MLKAITDFEGSVVSAPAAAKFGPGQLVCHRDERYRGVIVSVDPCCLAGDKWYFSNKSQPPRDQPWYHLLVHESGGLSTYVAESNLQADPVAKPITHPRVQVYFTGFDDGRYLPRQPSPSAACSV